MSLSERHLADILRSRLSDFLTTDGEKPDRNRDDEFEMADAAAREEILVWWDRGWSVALARFTQAFVPPRSS